jgi:hypothetical protein
MLLTSMARAGAAALFVMVSFFYTGLVLKMALLNVLISVCSSPKRVFSFSRGCLLNTKNADGSDATRETLWSQEPPKVCCSSVDRIIAYDGVPEWVGTTRIAMLNVLIGVCCSAKRVFSFRRGYRMNAKNSDGFDAKGEKLGS